MSFVYAEKKEGVIQIYCDTKISFSEGIYASISREQKVLIDKFGIVKTNIVCPTLSISFAGNNIFLASRLFKALCDKKTFEIEEAIDLAYRIHMEAKPDDIEFLIASYEGSESGEICCIKERKIERNVNFAWLGSIKAFQEFQKYRIKEMSAYNKDIHNYTSSAFREVVQSGIDDSVGKFMIDVRYYASDKSFEYCESLFLQTSKDQYVKANEPIQFHFDAADGGYTVNQTPISIEEFILDIHQMDACILFSRRMRCCQKDIDNEQLFSLMLPMLICEDGHGGWKRCG